MWTKYKILPIILLCVTAAVGAVTLDEARALFQKKQYGEALPAFQELYKKKPKDASINQWLGVCLYETESRQEAKKYFEFAATKHVQEANRYLSKLAAEEYDFESAQDYMDDYVSALERSKKGIPDDVRQDAARIRSAHQMIEHVEKITIIDSIVVDKDEFFKAYRISPETGRFCDCEVLPYEKPTSLTSVFVTESGETMLWASADSSGVKRLMSTSLLIDGTWEQYSQAEDMLNNDGDIDYPFLMPDGATLYYSCNGAGSIGGYDIYMTRKNSEDGSYFQPQNVGMPYNSPYDDYLLVIDEKTGIGWWATDRNQIPGKLTIYVYIPNELRVNYDADDDNLVSYAMVRSIKDTWGENSDFSEYFSRLESINDSKTRKKKEFEFAMAKGVVYTSYVDVKTTEGRSALEHYMATLAKQNEAKRQLAVMREQYHSADAGQRQQLKGAIMQSESLIEKRQQELEYLGNTVRKLEADK